MPAKPKTKPAAKAAQSPRLMLLIADTRPLHVLLIETHRQIAREYYGIAAAPATPGLKKLAEDIERLKPEIMKPIRRLARLYRAFNKSEPPRGTSILDKNIELRFHHYRQHESSTCAGSLHRFRFPGFWASEFSI